MPKYSWFLFSFTTRLKVLDNFRFIQTESYRLPRQKVKIDRDNILEGAMMIINDTSLLQQGILEMQYLNEIGTGNGPTLEFFMLLSQEIRKLDIWRNSTILFPAPFIPPEKNCFNFIGRVVGKAIIDRRYVELPLSPVFWKLVHRQPVTIIDLHDIDPELYRTLSGLQELVNQNIQNPEIISYKGATLEDLHLFFTLPGYENIELMPEGKQMQVNIENLQEYIDLVVKNTLIQATQISDFRDGLNSLIPVDALLGFSKEELEEIICGSSNDV